MITVIIPTLNEEEAIGGVVREIPRHLINEVIVVDNGSTDSTATRAQEAGAKVVGSPHRSVRTFFREYVLIQKLPELAKQMKQLLRHHAHLRWY